MDLQDALLDVDLDAGDQIWVAAGTYKPGSASSSTFNLENGVWLLGGFNGTETDRTEADPLANPTILSGDNVDGQGADASHVVTAIDITATITRLDGFTITGGNSGALGTGAGLRVEGDQTTSTVKLIVSRCTFEGNTGGAAAVAKTGTLQPTTLEVAFTNCVFKNNTGGNGAAVYIHKSSTVWMNNCLVFNNTVSGNGGGVYLGLTCNDVDECDVALCQPNFAMAHLNSCTFSGNQADGYGGAVYISRGENVEATGSIFWGNTDSSSGSNDVEGQQISTEISRVNAACDFVATYSCIQGLSAYANTGNIPNDPLFVAPSSGWYQLRASSLAIDAGDVGSGFPQDDLDFNYDTDTNELAPDLDRHKRVINSTIDMGAYEHLCGCEADFINSVSWSPPPDGVVDAADLSFLLGAWGPNPGSPADIVDNQTFAPPPDGVVDAADLAWLLNTWGACTDKCEEEESLMGGGEGASSGPFDGTEIGDLLDQLLEENDEETEAELVAQLLELLTE